MKQKIRLSEAENLAAALVEKLKPSCQRVEIAGSVRRQKSEIGDIEIVAIPLPCVDMFGAEMEYHQLDSFDWNEIGRLVKGGHKYKQIELHDTGINLDLFIVTPPAQWGVQFVIRTGAAEFSHRFVTPRNFGGLLPSYLKVKDGAIWNKDKMVETPEEKDVFDLLGIQWIEPRERL